MEGDILNMFSNKIQGFIYLERNRLYFYNKSLLALDFAPDLLNNLDVVNKESLYANINAFIENNKIRPIPIMIILSESVLFEKNIVAVPPQLEAEKTKFLQSVPFENLSVKEFRIEKGIKIAATNKDLHESISKAFEMRGFVPQGVVPYFVLSKALSAGLTSQSVRGVLKALESLKPEFSLINPGPSKKENVSEQTSVIKKLPRRTLILIGIFGTLLLVLVGFLIITFFQKPSSSPQPAVTVLSTPIPETASDIAEFDALRVQVLNAGGTTTQADALKKQLESLGIENISIENGKNINTTKTLILFSSSVDRQVREVVVDTIRKTASDIAVQEGEDLSFDVIVTLGKPPTEPSLSVKPTQ